MYIQVLNCHDNKLGKIVNNCTLHKLDSFLAKYEVDGIAQITNMITT